MFLRHRRRFRHSWPLSEFTQSGGTPFTITNAEKNSLNFLGFVSNIYKNTSGHVLFVDRQNLFLRPVFAPLGDMPRVNMRTEGGGGKKGINCWAVTSASFSFSQAEERKKFSPCRAHIPLLRPPNAHWVVLMGGFWHVCVFHAAFGSLHGVRK